MIDRRASCEPGLKLDRVFAKIVEKAGEPRRTRRAEFLRPLAGELLDRRQMVGERVPFRFWRIFKRMSIPQWGDLSNFRQIGCSDQSILFS